jgi:hypothetical protein
VLHLVVHLAPLREVQRMHVPREQRLEEQRLLAHPQRAQRRRRLRKSTGAGGGAPSERGTTQLMVGGEREGGGQPLPQPRLRRSARAVRPRSDAAAERGGPCAPRASPVPSAPPANEWQVDAPFRYWQRRGRVRGAVPPGRLLLLYYCCGGNGYFGCYPCCCTPHLLRR